VVATIIDGLFFGTVYWLLALAFGDIGTEGEAANWVSNLPAWASVAYGLFIVGYYILLEGDLGEWTSRQQPASGCRRNVPPAPPATPWSSGNSTASAALCAI
jgi:hypothetical protein